MVGYLKYPNCPIRRNALPNSGMAKSMMKEPSSAGQGLKIDASACRGVAGANLAYRDFEDSFRSIEGFSVCKVLTRRTFDSFKGHTHHENITNSLDEPIDQAVVVFEYAASSLCATDVIYAGCRIDRSLGYTNTRFRVTSGSFFVDRGLGSEPLLDEVGYCAAFDEKMARDLVPANYSRQSEARRELKSLAEGNGIFLEAPGYHDCRHHLL